MPHPLHQFTCCPKCGSKRFEENNFKSKKCADCGFVYYFNSSAAVAVFITDRKGRLLVARRAHDPAKGTYDLPGGFVDMHETGEEAAIREVREETNILLKHQQLHYTFSLPNIYVFSGFEVHTLDMFFEATIERINTHHPSDDVDQLFLLTSEEIISEKFGLFSVRKAIEKWKFDADN
jgi:ADP-ribose pyrophosphatase YjhB (NUDIX family)